MQQEGGHNARSHGSRYPSPAARRPQPSVPGWLLTGANYLEEPPLRGSVGNPRAASGPASLGTGPLAFGRLQLSIVGNSLGAVLGVVARLLQVSWPLGLMAPGMRAAFVQTGWGKDAPARVPRMTLSGAFGMRTRAGECRRALAEVSGCPGVQGAVAWVLRCPWAFP